MIPKLFLDIESTPGPTRPLPEDIKAPGTMSKPETIRAYQEANVENEYQKQSLNSMKGEIFCVGLCLEGGEAQIIRGANERETMELLAGAFDKIAGAWHEPLHLVGWNIITFDMPWIWRKAIKYGLTGIRNAIPRGNPHLTTDLMKVWAADFKDYVSLASCADFLGVQHGGGNGSEIYQLWLMGDYEAIDNHCLRDIKTTMAIYEKMMTS
ncbi:MAG TPA: ribonuclease H-like domain-containing protein [Syntrophales bacterium]|nr:ribonuclease H-like domain-containing protein [Syntrophales bacterium]